MAIKDLHEFIARLEKKGQLRRTGAFFTVNGFVAVAILAGAMLDRLIG